MQKPIYTNEESKTFDQVINQVSEGIVRRSIFNDLPQELYEGEIEDIDSLKSSFDEFTNHEYARHIKDYKCEEITIGFIEAYKRFLQLKAPYEDGTIPAIAHLMTLGKILYLSDLCEYFDWEPTLLNRYKRFTPF